MLGLLQSMCCNPAFPSTVLSSFHSSAHVFFPPCIPSFFCLLLPLTSSLSACPSKLPPMQMFPPWRGLFWLTTWGFLLHPMWHVYNVCGYPVILSPAQQTDFLSSPCHFLRILILMLTTLSLAICMNVRHVHSKPSLLSSEVVLTPSVTQTATWKMHVLSHFSHIPLFATPWTV